MPTEAPPQKVIQLHARQDEAMFTDKRFVAIVAGLQSGKTLAGALWSRIEFDKHPGDDGIITAPSYKILSQSTLPKFFELNPDLVRFYKKADQVIEVPGRGRIFIRSTENPNVLEGMTLRWAWMDEAGQMKREAWTNIQGRLSIKQGKAFLTTTPYSMNWLYADFYEKWKLAEPGFEDYHVVQYASTENPYFPKEEFERVKSTMDRRVFARRYCGTFEKMEGLVYDEFHQGNCVRDSMAFPQEYDHVVAGIDWGFTHPTAIVVFGVCDRAWYLLDEWYEARKTFDEVKEAAKILKERFKITRWYADSARPEFIEEFNRAGLHTVPAIKDIEFGVGKVRELIRDDRLFVSKKCVSFIDEIEQYHFPEVREGQAEKEVPEKTDDDMMDAARYAVATFQPGFGRRRGKDRDGGDEGNRAKVKTYRKPLSYVGI